MMAVPPAIATATIVETNQIFVNYICVEIGKLKKLPHGNRSVTTIVETRYILYVKFPTHVVDEYLDEELSVRHIHRILFSRWRGEEVLHNYSLLICQPSKTNNDRENPPLLLSHIPDILYKIQAH